jgi:4a-hydroxytetrahydrobiopterin dehydratase
MMRNSLINKACIPCRGGDTPLAHEDCLKLLNELKDGWRINDKDHLYKEYQFDNFMGALSFANKIGNLAEKEGHHPNLVIAWGKCAVEIWTHKINGLTESDFILAAKIEIIQ